MTELNIPDVAFYAAGRAAWDAWGDAERAAFLDKVGTAPSSGALVAAVVRAAAPHIAAAALRQFAEERAHLPDMPDWVLRDLRARADELGGESS